MRPQNLLTKDTQLDTLFIEVRADMRITKTSAQAQADKKAREQAEAQTREEILKESYE